MLKTQSTYIPDNTNINYGNKIINILDSIVYKKPVQISNFNLELVCKNTNNKCCKCIKTAYYINNNDHYCWEHVQIIDL
jgi:hypothetical protein